MSSNDTPITENVASEQEQQQQQQQNQEFVSRDFLVKAGIITEDQPKPDETPQPAPEETAAAQGGGEGQQKPEETKQKPIKQRKVARGYAARGDLPVEEIAKAAAVAAVEAVNKTASTQPQQTQPPKPEDLEQQIISRMDDEQKRLLQTFEIVEKNNPNKYKNLRSNAIKALAEYERLRDEWLKENPEKSRDDFDSEGEIMADIEQRFGLEVDEQDLLDADIKSQIDPVKQELERTRKELEEARVALAAERAAEQIKGAREVAAYQVFQTIGINPEEAEKILEKGTPASDVLKREIEAINNFVEAAYLSFAGVKHPLTEQVAELCMRYEEALMNMPENERIDNAGRKFINRDTYNSLPLQERILIDKGTHPKYWGLNADLASTLGTSIIAERTKKNFSEAIQKEAKLLQEHGIKPSYSFMNQQNKNTSQGQRQQPPAQPAARRPQSPTSVNPIGGHTPGPQSSDVPSEFLQRFLGKAPIGGGVTYEPTKD